MREDRERVVRTYRHTPAHTHTHAHVRVGRICMRARVRACVNMYAHVCGSARSHLSMKPISLVDTVPVHLISRACPHGRALAYSAFCTFTTAMHAPSRLSECMMYFSVLLVDTFIASLVPQVVKGIVPFHCTCAAAGFIVDGYVSKPERSCGRGASDMQFLYINRRPVDIPNLSRAVNQTFRQYNTGGQMPIFFLNIDTQTNKYDINVTPDKRKVCRLYGRVWASLFVVVVVVVVVVMAEALDAVSSAVR